MDEFEYDEYLHQIDLLDERLDCPAKVPGEDAIADQLRDEWGIRVPGAYHIKPIRVIE